MVMFMNTARESRSLGITFYKHKSQKSIPGTNWTYIINVPRTLFLDEKYEDPDYHDYIVNEFSSLKKVIDARFRKMNEPIATSTVCYGKGIFIISYKIGIFSSTGGRRQENYQKGQNHAIQIQIK